MNSKGIGVFIAFVAVAFGAWLWFRAADTAPVSPALPGVTPTNQVAAATAPSGNVAEKSLQDAANALGAAQTAGVKKDALATLRDVLSSGSTNEIVAAIRKLLEAKTDTGTGQGFKIGGGGVLLEAPTLRTLLLDQLAALDPAAAAEVARQILNSSVSPDEWAISLRNLARGDTSAEARTLLETKTGELLRNEAWQRDPSVGYLEAFDAAVHLGGTKLVAPLTDLVTKKDNQAVAHAAFLTLDRLVINDAANVLAELNVHPETMTGREETRANYFARADVGDTTQRELVETYLLNPSRGPAELQTFAGVFPNANFMISHNLLTQNRTFDGQTLRQRDLAALEVVNQWLADSRFEKVKEPLTQIQARLKQFTEQAGKTKTGN